MNSGYDLKTNAILFALMVSVVLFSPFVMAQEGIPQYQPIYVHCYPHHTPPVTETPPYSIDMPLEVYQTYFVLDSLCKNTEINSDPDLMGEQMRQFLSVSQMDTLAKYIYLTREWDILRFHSYCAIGNFLNNRYRVAPYWFWAKLMYNLPHNYSDIERLRRHFITFADGIFEIEITEVHDDSTTSRGDRSVKDQAIVCLKGRVLDVIQGNGLTESYTQEEGGNPYWGISFSYAKNWFTKGGRVSYAGIDSGVVIPMPTTFGQIHDPVVGEKYLVFLEYRGENHIDITGNIPFNIFPMNYYQEEGGLFKIDGDSISDHDNFFGLGQSPNINDVKDEIRDIIVHDILFEE